MCLRDLQFNSGMLRFKVIWKFKCDFMKKTMYPPVSMPTGSEIQRWLVAIHGVSGNWIRVFKKKVYVFSVCLRDLKFNGDLLRFKVILEIELWYVKGNYLFSVCLRDLKFNGGLLRCKVILEIEILFSWRNYVSFGMPSRSEIKRWLVAI